MGNNSDRFVEVFRDAADLAAATAAWLVQCALATDGRLAIVLAGGSTPRLLYQCLAASPCRDRFPWARTHFFWGDERFVPPGSADSNFRMVQEALLAHVPIPAEQVHPIPTGGTPMAAAAAYEQELRLFYGEPRSPEDRPLFDVVLLGLGSDGHTASLFPDTQVLAERDRWVGISQSPDGRSRITLTYPALQSSRNVIFLVTGESKRAVLRGLLRGDPALPAARLRPHGKIRIHADRAALPDTSQISRR